MRTCNRHLLVTIAAVAVAVSGQSLAIAGRSCGINRANRLMRMAAAKKAKEVRAIKRKLKAKRGPDVFYVFRFQVIQRKAQPYREGRTIGVRFSQRIIVRVQKVRGVDAAAEAEWQFQHSRMPGRRSRIYRWFEDEQAANNFVARITRRRRR